MEKKKVTERVIQALEKKKQVPTKSSIAKMLGISRPTLDAKLENHNWEKEEILILKENKII